MSDQRIILANGSRLLREMLNRIMLRSEHLKIVKEIADHNTLPAALEGQSAEWLVMSIPVDEKPPDWVDTYVKGHPFLRVMAFAADGSWIKMKWMESHEEDLTDRSLKELIHILENNPADIPD